MSLTGDINLDTDLMMKLDDRELGMVCKVNRKARQICESSLLWRKRLQYFFPLDNDKINFILENYTFTLKELYIMLRNASNFRLMITWLEEIPNFFESGSDMESLISTEYYKLIPALKKYQNINK